MRIRLLPIVIAVAGAMLVLRTATLWFDADLVLSAQAQTAEQGSEKSKDKPEKKDAQKASKDGAAADGDDKAKQDGAADTAMAQTEPAEFDAEDATSAEIAVLDKLGQRRKELERRARTMDLRESVLEATEKRLDTKISELKKIQATIDSMLQKHDEQQDKKMKSLVKIYESMKPKDAARIFERLELPILLDVIERMREAKSAPILAKMNPGRAKAVTAALAVRRSLPNPSEIN